MFTDVRYPLAEKFLAPQGEGIYTGTQFAFMRLVGCSVGKRICHACDTDFEKVYEALGGGMFTPIELVKWAYPCAHVCFTGGEPLDRDLRHLFYAFWADGCMVHVETSGTVIPEWLRKDPDDDAWLVQPFEGDWQHLGPNMLWVTVSPKPGYSDAMIGWADELKVIVGGLGDGPGWPTIDDAVEWANEGKLVYVQPRNNKHTVDDDNLKEVLRLMSVYPQLRLSVQAHKFWKTR